MVLHDVRLKTTHGIMPALDMESLDVMKRVVEATTRIEGVVAYKFGLMATLRLGLEATVRALRAVTDLPLIYDHQKAGADVPDMAAKFAATCRQAEVDGLILFPVARPRAVDEFVSYAFKHRLLPWSAANCRSPTTRSRARLHRRRCAPAHLRALHSARRGPLRHSGQRFRKGAVSCRLAQGAPHDAVPVPSRDWDAGRLDRRRLRRRARVPALCGGGTRGVRRLGSGRGGKTARRRSARVRVRLAYGLHLSFIPNLTPRRVPRRFSSTDGFRPRPRAKPSQCSTRRANTRSPIPPRRDSPT